MSSVQQLASPQRDVDANIRTNTKILMSYRGLKGSDLWKALGLTRATFSNRMTGAARWSASEVVQLAELLDVTVETLAQDPADLVRTGSR